MLVTGFKVAIKRYSMLGNISVSQFCIQYSLKHEHVNM